MCVPSEDSNQPAQRGLIRVFAVHLKKGRMFGYQNSAQREYRSDCANALADQNLSYARISKGIFYSVSAHIFLYDAAHFP